MSAGGRLALLACVAVCSSMLPTPAPAGAAVHGLLTGFTDPSFESSSASDRTIAAQHARAAGASVIRLTFGWNGIAPSAPPNLDITRDPSWSGYRWSPVDTAVRDVVAGGLTPLFEVNAAPSWAEGPNRPPLSQARVGAWRPSAPAFEAFAQALAKRYSGHYPDPERPGFFLPRVRYWQAWNEPNLNDYISPQWVRVGGKLVAASPDIYRALLNGFYSGIKSVDRSDVVVTAGTAPYGDPPGGLRIPPALFVRDLFCLRGRNALKRFRCPDSPVHFDALAHHPYPIGPPRRHAPNPDDVVVPDLGRITRPLAVALKDGTVAPKGRKPLWATEISWDSNPPDPGGLPAHLQARYLEGALSELWSEGVSVVTWFNMRDEPVGRGYQYTLQSGIYFRGNTIADDTRKPSFTAFLFPFTAYLHRGVAQLWGLAPRPGQVTIQVKRGAHWRTIRRLSARRDRLFMGRQRIAPRTVVRATQGGQASMPWTVFSPN